VQPCKAIIGADTVNIGFISFRLAGTDGVSLETSKWGEIMHRLGHQIYYFAGELDPHSDSRVLLNVPIAGSQLVDRAHFTHPMALWITKKSFGTMEEHDRLRIRMENATAHLKRALTGFISRFHIDLLVIENVFAISLNLPLSMALRRVIFETKIPTIAHHHDFYWERERFATTCVDDILFSTFPPKLPNVRHAVINSKAQQQLHERGFESTYIPNVFDYAAPMPQHDAFNRDLRAEIGLDEGDIFFLQPTRVIRRKGIELAIELVSRLGDLPIKLIVTHQAEFDTLDYLAELYAIAARCHVNLYYLPVRFEPQRHPGSGINKVFSLWDAYLYADFVTYPSLYEGFGNALLETFYFRKPVLVNRYPVYVGDIEPYQPDVIAIDGAITDETVAQVRALIGNRERAQAMADHNAGLAAEHFSYEVLQRKLADLIASFD
jgi:glycosyltransferase involved in cell wall biosynthesis